MYLLSDSRVKRVTREFSFYNVRFYREERVPELTVCLDYPAGNVYWYLDFKKLIETDILSHDKTYETEWKAFLIKLKSTIKSEFEVLQAALNAITPKTVLDLMGLYNLRDYQAFDLAQLIIKMRQTDVCAGLILSEQRTGKTRVAIATVCELLKTNYANVAVICPKSAINSWVDEINEMNRYFGKYTFSVQVFKRMKEVTEPAVDTSSQFQVRIISYDLFKRFTFLQMKKALCALNNNLVLIGDEIHRLRNFKSLQSDMLFRFKEGCLKEGIDLYLLGLTGTPAVKGSADVFGTFSFINTSKIGFQNTTKDFNEFKEYFYNCEDTSYGKIAKTLRRTSELNFLVQISAVQTKQKDLPMFENYERKYIRIDLDTDEHQREIYDSVLNTFEYGTDIDCSNTLVQLTRLQQICISPKALVASYAALAPKLKWILGFAARKKVKTIVMAKKLTALNELASEFDKNGIKYSFLKGATGLKDRAEQVSQFRTDPDIRFILIQLDVGREALTLPEATCTIFLDRDFAQGYNEQAEARMTPIDGVACTKYVIDLVMRDTVEEHIYNILVMRKQSIADVNSVSEFCKKGGIA